MASFFVEVRVPFFRTLMQISLSLHRVPAFREGDKAEREGRQYLSASSLLPWPSASLAQLTMKCVQVLLDFV